jgi:hypothetical protein
VAERCRDSIAREGSPGCLVLLALPLLWWIL